MICYYHRDYLHKEVELPVGHEPSGFCTNEEKEMWADKTYGVPGEKKIYHSKQYMVDGFKRMATEERAKKLNRFR